MCLEVSENEILSDLDYSYVNIGDNQKHQKFKPYQNLEKLSVWKVCSFFRVKVGGICSWTVNKKTLVAMKMIICVMGIIEFALFFGFLTIYILPTYL